jgi:hypothetical protein
VINKIHIYIYNTFKMSLYKFKETLGFLLRKILRFEGDLTAGLNKVVIDSHTVIEKALEDYDDKIEGIVTDYSDKIEEVVTDYEEAIEEVVTDYTNKFDEVYEIIGEGVSTVPVKLNKVASDTELVLTAGTWTRLPLPSIVKPKNEEWQVTLFVKLGATSTRLLAGVCDMISQPVTRDLLILESNQGLMAVTASGIIPKSSTDTSLYFWVQSDSGGTIAVGDCGFMYYSITAIPEVIIDSLTPVKQVYLGPPDYNNYLPFISLPQNVEYTVPDDGYLRVTYSQSTGTYAAIVVNGSHVYRSGDVLRNQSEQTTRFLVMVSKDDIVKVESDGTLVNIGVSLIYPKSPPPLFVEGADLQSSEEIGKVKIDEVTKEMTVNGNMSGFMPFPDYANQGTTNLLSGAGEEGSWLSDRDGYVKLECSVGSGAGLDFYIDDARIYSLGSAGVSGITLNGRDVVAIMKGQRLKGNSASAVANFIPIKWIQVTNPVSRITSLTPLDGIMMGFPNSTDITTLAVGTDSTFPKNIASGASSAGMEWTMSNDGYIAVGVGIATSTVALSETSFLRCQLQLRSGGVGTMTPIWGVTFNGLNNDSVSNIFPVRKGDKIRIQLFRTGTTTQVTYTSNTSLMFYRAAPATPVFIEGVDLQSSDDMGKVAVDLVNKTMSVNGMADQIGIAETNGKPYLMSRPDTWPTTGNVNFPNNIVGLKRYAADSGGSVTIGNYINALLDYGGYVSNGTYEYSIKCLPVSDTNSCYFRRTSSGALQLMMGGDYIGNPREYWVIYRKM